MAILTDMRERICTLDSQFGVDVDGADLVAAARRWETDAVVAMVEIAAAVKHDADRLMAVGAAILSERSSRDLGQSGAAAVRGHSSPVSLVQSISGGTRADAVRAVRVGGALLDGSAGANESSELAAAPVERPWHESLGRAMFAGLLTPAQHDAILRGVGEPPERLDGVGEVWGLAAAQLVAEADGIEVEELARRARQVRDALDPIGTEERCARRFEAPSFRTWTDADGGRHGRIDFDDEGAAFWDSVIASALRPRRGGPRFMTAEEREAAADLVADTRTNEQLTYDLVTDVFRAGALATASDVFGVRQPGVRIVVVRDAIGPRDAFGRLVATAHLEDGGDALPGSVIDRALCDVGSVKVTVDSCGNPLDVGSDDRLFTPKQKMALAVRDGGCLWPGCRVPASYCEAHHSEHWAEGGRTDIESGVLLCRFHHMLLHNAGWRIRRDGRGPFVLHRPPGIPEDPVVLPSRSAVRWAWDSPRPEMRTGWRAA
ncbi:DUF222 domain-containing protein [uncultured Microbacterium sp.]|uniref:HNH endonuclease signature motif containing protein n=1 Tax=uncultured Microbacterium sp. TaxID=191216 RepID=UPI0028D64B0A|nr:DUF222 domain-containing protein [uncultured Microbacterium sp.]